MVLTPSCAPHSRIPLLFRLLLQLTQSQQTSFALEKNLRTQREIEDRMKGFSFKEDTLLVMAEVSESPWVCVKAGILDICAGSRTVL